MASNSSSKWLTSKIRSTLPREGIGRALTSEAAAGKVHSCSHCTQFSVRPDPRKSSSVLVNLSKREINKAIDEGCSFVKWCVAEANDADIHPPLKFEIIFTTNGNDGYDLVEAEFRFHPQYGPSLTVCAADGTSSGVAYKLNSH